MFRFGFDGFLYAYLLVPAFAVFLWYAFRSRRRALLRFGNADLVNRLSRSVSRRGQLVKAFLLVAAVFMTVSALARPQFGTRVETVRREGLDIVIALDVSASMLAEDVAPNRLAKAKLGIASLFDRLQGDRVALVAFAGRAFVQTPLTSDYGAAQMFLNAMDPDLIPVPGTALAEGLDRSLGAFPPDQQGHKILVLITDGEDHVGDVDSRVQRAVEEGVVIHTVGIGSAEGVPIPDIDSLGRRRGFKKDDTGEVVLTRLDEATLQSIARSTNGTYYHSRVGESELGALADDIAEREKRELEGQELTQFEEQFQIFVGLALLLLTAEVLVPERRRLETEWRGRFQ